MDNFWYLFAAYALIWLGLFIYIFSLSRREKQLGEEIEDLKVSLAKLEKKEDS
ncbi:uncharacterized protein METZ01_LOCUS96997 [marine metagenome]|uniref:CcmD family protein n=1 Tax=marine metagenome TaxID=408172 RepID=A0A381VX07_9ZZZZ